MQETQLVEQNKELKVRLFDAQETLQAERDSMSQFIGVLAQVLKLEGEEAQNLQNYVDAVIALVEGKDEPKEESVVST